MGALRSEDGGGGRDVLRLVGVREAAGEAAPAMAVADHVAHLSVNGASATAIGREWAEKAHPTCGGLCRPGDCTFSGGFCLVVAHRHVPRHLCRTYRAVQPAAEPLAPEAVS